MARRPDSKRKRKKTNTTNNDITYTPRRDWSKITFYVFSLTIVLAMVCALFIQIISV